MSSNGSAYYHYVISSTGALLCLTSVGFTNVSYTGGRSTYDGASGSFGVCLYLTSTSFTFVATTGFALSSRATTMDGVRLFSESFARVYNSGDANDGNPSAMRGVLLCLTSAYFAIVHNSGSAYHGDAYGTLGVHLFSVGFAYVTNRGLANDTSAHTAYGVCLFLTDLVIKHRLKWGKLKWIY